MKWVIKVFVLPQLERNMSLLMPIICFRFKNEMRQLIRLNMCVRYCFLRTRTERSFEQFRADFFYGKQIVE